MQTLRSKLKYAKRFRVQLSRLWRNYVKHILNYTPLGASRRIDLLSTLCVLFTCVSEFISVVDIRYYRQYTIPMLIVILENSLNIDFVFNSTIPKIFYIFLDVWQSVTTHKLCRGIIYVVKI